MIEVSGVRHRYGSTRALVEVSAELGSRVVALLGPNGAGKSTLLGLLSTALRLQQGRVVVAGQDLSGWRGRAQARRTIGYVPQAMDLPATWSCNEVLLYACWMRGTSAAADAAAAALASVDLTERQGSRVGELSGGMRQRLCVAQALVHRPSVLIVDEPTVGLDPLQRVQLRQVLKGLDCQVVIATHLVDDVAALAEQVLILDQGRVVFDGELQALCAGRVDAAAVEAAYVRHVQDPERS